MASPLSSQISELNTYISSVEKDITEMRANAGKLDGDVRQLNERISKIVKSANKEQLQQLQGEAFTTAGERLKNVDTLLESVYWERMGTGQKILSKVARFFYGLAGKQYRASEAINAEPIVQLADLSKMLSKEHQRVTIAKQQILQAKAPKSVVPTPAPADNAAIQKMRGEVAQAAHAHFPAVGQQVTDKLADQMHANLKGHEFHGKEWASFGPVTDREAPKGSHFQIEVFAQKGLTESARTGASYGVGIYQAVGQSNNRAVKFGGRAVGFIAGALGTVLGAAKDATRAAGRVIGMDAGTSHRTEFVSVEQQAGKTAIVVRDDDGKELQRFNNVAEFKAGYLDKKVPMQQVVSAAKEAAKKAEEKAALDAAQKASAQATAAAQKQAQQALAREAAARVAASPARSPSPQPAPVASDVMQAAAELVAARSPQRSDAEKEASASANLRQALQDFAAAQAAASPSSPAGVARELHFTPEKADVSPQAREMARAMVDTAAKRAEAAAEAHRAELQRSAAQIGAAGLPGAAAAAAEVSVYPEWLGEGSGDKKADLREFRAVAQKMAQGKGLDISKGDDVFCFVLAQVQGELKTPFRVTGGKNAVASVKAELAAARQNLNKLPIMQHYYVVDAMNQKGFFYDDSTVPGAVLADLNKRLASMSATEKSELKALVQQNREKNPGFYDKIRI